MTVETKPSSRLCFSRVATVAPVATRFLIVLPVVLVYAHDAYLPREICDQDVEKSDHAIRITYVDNGFWQFVSIFEELKKKERRESDLVALLIS